MKAGILLQAPTIEDKGWGEEELHKARAKETSSSSSSYQNNQLELRLGISLSNSYGEGKVVSGRPPEVAAQRWLPQIGSGLLHPWSLAARQQKAVLERAHLHKPNPSSSASSSFSPSATRPPLPIAPVIGWPPVRVFRRNLTCLHSLKQEMGRMDNVKRAKISEDGTISGPDQLRPSMFVKVNMEGYFVGRKINLATLDSCESLTDALHKMTHNFLSVHYLNNPDQEEEPNDDYIFLYCDNEGDWMLIGDVPWQLFITTAKRLYILRNRSTSTSANGTVAEQKDQETEN